MSQRGSLNSELSYSHTSRKRPDVKSRTSQRGKVRPLVLLWALGVPLPLVLIVWLVRGCVS